MRFAVILLCVGLLGGLAGCQSDRPKVAESQVSESQVAAALPDMTKPAAGDLYYFDTCPMCGAMLGTRGDAVERVYDSRQVRFCERACADAFEQDYDANRAKLDATLLADQRPYYPLDTCVVTGKPLGTTPVDFVCRNRMVRVVDVSARKQFEANPEAYWKSLNEAAISKHAPGYAVEKCPVQGTKLEKEASTLTTVVIANRLVRTCCRDCAKLVRAKPSHYLPLIDSAHRVLRAGKEKVG